MPLRGALGVVVLAAIFAIGPAAARAATFYVDDSSPTAAVPCTAPPPAASCQTIMAAVAQARGVTGPNKIEVAAGTYTEAILLNDNPHDDGLTIEGAGQGTTRIVLPNAATVGVNMARPGQTVRHLSVEVPSTTTAVNKEAIVVGNSAQTLDDVGALMSGGDAISDPAIQVFGPAGARTLSHLDVSDNGNTAWTSKALDILAIPGPVTVSDSTFQSNERVIETFADKTILRRVVAETTSTAFGKAAVAVVSPGPLNNSAGTKDATLTISSSLVIGGQEGVVASNGFTDAAHQTATANVRNTTIDPLLPRGTDGVAGVDAFDNVNNATATVSVDSSIVLRPAFASNSSVGGASSVTCANTDIPNGVFAGDPTHGPISCGTAPGNTAGNSTTDPSLLFVFAPPFFLNWHLSDTSPAIDTGSPLALTSDESTTDLDANDRILNGIGVCPAVRDKGAYEHAAGGDDCSPPPPPPPDTGSQPPPMTTPAPTATPKKKCKRNKKKHRSARHRQEEEVQKEEAALVL